MKYLYLVSLFFFFSCSDSLSDDCDPDAGAEVCEVYALVNAERDEVNLVRYTWNSELASAAQAHARDMAERNYFDHRSQDGRSFSDRVDATDYDGFATGENIAKGQESAGQVMSSWMKSIGHKQNILNNESKEIGVGHYSGLWVQVFGR